MKIEIERTRIKLSPYDLGQSRTLERRLSIYDFVNHVYTDRLFMYDLETKTLYVPKGMGIMDIKECLKDDYINDYNIEDMSSIYIQPRENIKISMRPDMIMRDETQKKSVEFLTDYININNSQKMLNLTTGWGKTFCAIKSISLLSMPALIVVDTETLMDQWYKVILQYTYAKPSEIIRIQGRQSVEKIMKTKSKEIFYIASLLTLDICAKEGILDKFLNHIKVGIKIVDEAHKKYIANTHIDLMSNIMNNFYLTATPQRSDSKEDEMYSRIMKNIPKFGSYTTELNKYTHVRNIYINTYPSAFEERICHTRTGFNAIKYETFIFKKEKQRLYWCKITENIINKVINNIPDGRILILLSKNDHINMMTEYLENVFDNIKIGRLNSTIKDKAKRADQLSRKIILSTVQSSGTGLDIKNLRVIIVFTPFRSFVTLHQLFGRLRYIEGKALFYFNIIDEGYADCVRLSHARLGFFRKKAASIKNIDMPINNVLNVISNESKEIVF